jgi:GT2 family glycosyltransferase
MTDVSIIIVSWNTREILEQCLKSIYEKTRDIYFEVILVDNASVDDTQEMVLSKFPQVTVIANDVNRGFACANNQGIAVASGRYVLLLNSDTLLYNNAIQKTVVFADLHPDMAVVGCKILNSDRTVQPSCFMFHSILNMFLAATYLYKLFPRNKFCGRQSMAWWDGADVREVDSVNGCFMLVRRKSIKEVGAMDERFFMYGEETDWCYRFKKAGWKVLYAPEGEIVHLGGQSTAQKAGEMIVQLRISILQFIGKHYGRLTFYIAYLLTIIFFSVRLPVWCFIGFVNPVKRKRSLIQCKAYWHGIHEVLIKGRKLRQLYHYKNSARDLI